VVPAFIPAALSVAADLLPPQAARRAAVTAAVRMRVFT
jgi:hypothetical protein